MDKFSLNFVKTDISDLLQETYNSFQLAAEEKDIIFKLELARYRAAGLCGSGSIEKNPQQPL